MDDRVSWRQRLLPLVNLAPVLIASVVTQLKVYFRPRDTDFGVTYFVPPPGLREWLVWIALTATMLLPMVFAQRQAFALTCTVVGALVAVVCVALVWTVMLAPWGIGLILAGFARRRYPVVIGFFVLVFGYDVWFTGSTLL